MTTTTLKQLLAAQADLEANTLHRGLSTTERVTVLATLHRLAEQAGDLAFGLGPEELTAEEQERADRLARELLAEARAVEAGER
jgi:hypothetical protein